MSRAKGTKYENRLVAFFDTAGFMMMRSPSSGSATDRDQPDVLVVNDDVGAYAFEVKFDGDPSGIIYLEPEEIEQLERFARGTGSIPLVATRWSQDAAFYLWLPEDLDRTDGGNYRVHRDDVDADRYVGVLADGENHGMDGGGHGATPHAVRRIGPLLDEDVLEDRGMIGEP